MTHTKSHVAQQHNPPSLLYRHTAMENTDTDVVMFFFFISRLSEREHNVCEIYHSVEAIFNLCVAKLSIALITTENVK